MNNIYIRREGVPQIRTKAYKGDKGWSGGGGGGRGWGVSKHDKFRAYK